MPLGKTHHRLVNGCIAVRVKLHRLADNVGTLCAASAKKPHLVHSVKKLSVRRLKPVNFGDCT